MLSQNQVVKVQKALESLYDGVMNVVEYQQTTDSITHITSASEIEVQTAIPCRLSFTTSPQTEGSDVASISQVVKVFFSPDITIKAGSKIVITQNGITTNYVHSGVESVYDTHKEVVLDLFERWA